MYAYVTLIRNVSVVFKKGIFQIFYLLYSILLHLPPSDSTVLEDSGIEPRTVATLALAVSHTL
jgi:hypothetical protein